MALLVIVCGALLVIGGAISLLMGFDIVMTERGSAMTLGGIIALSGGMITVGIGFALLRLSQILAALQERNSRGVRPVVTPDRPVIPAVSAEPVNSGDVPVEPVAEPGMSRIGLGAGLGAGAVAAGLGAGLAAAGVAASATGLAATKQDQEKPDPDAAPAQQPAVPDVADIDIPGMPDLPSPETAAASLASPIASWPIPDLEEELARALAEPEVASLPGQAREKSFADGLSDLLAKPKGRKRRPEPELEAGSEPEADQDEEPVEASVSQLFAETIADADPLEVSAATADAIAGEAAAAAIAAEPEAAAAAMPETFRAADELTGDDRADASQNAPVIPSKKVLGTYHAGGRTYSMFADGSVEAITENGVERFSSMDELRRHLVRP